MIILAVLLVLAIIGLWYGDIYNELLFLVGAISTTLLILACFTIGINRLGNRSSIVKFESIVQTIEVARENDETWEIASIQRDIVTSNKWLANIQYWNGTLFDLWIIDDVMDLEPIK